LAIFEKMTKLKNPKAILLISKPQIVSLLAALQFLYGRYLQAKKIDS
tara:strand:+ start:6597 stop:6737 length:141 start_codon:yes stop_codon:yes gene_type:complete